MSAQSFLFPTLPEVEPAPPPPKVKRPPPEPGAPCASFWAGSQALLTCPGDCRALRSSEQCALDAARRTQTTGLRTQTGCSQCGGGALAVVTCLSPVTLRSRGGIPKKRPFQPWEEHDAWRMTVLQERVIGLDWAPRPKRLERYVFRRGWKAIGWRKG